MIVGFGVDIVPVAQIGENLHREAYLRRTFTPAELAECKGAANAAERLAGRFAAKEAFMKALGSGIQQGMWFTQIEVLSQPGEQPSITASGEAASLLAALGDVSTHVSISHTAGLAVSVVILEVNSDNASETA